MRLAVKISLVIIAFIAFLMVGLYFFVQSNTGQNFVSKKTNEILSSQFPDATIEIKKIAYQIPDYIEIEDFCLGASQKDTIIFVANLSVDVAMLQLLFGTIKADNINLKHATIDLKRLNDESTFNYERVLGLNETDEVSPESSSSSTSFAYDIGSVSLEDVKVVFEDYPGGILFRSHFDQLEAAISEINPAKNAYGLDNLEINGGFVDASIYQSTLVEVDTTSSALPTISLEEFDMKAFDIAYKDDLTGLATKANLGSFSALFETINLAENTIEIEEIELANSTIKVETYEGQETTNPSPANEQTSPWYILLGEFQMANTGFKYDNLTKPTQLGTFDPNHITIANSNLTLENFSYQNENIKGKLGDLNFSLNDQLTVLEASTLFGYTPKGIKLEDLNFKTNSSTLTSNLDLKYESIQDLTEHLDNFTLDLSITESSLSLFELSQVLPSITAEIDSLSAKDIIRLDARVTGNNEAVTIKKFTASLLGNTSVKMTGQLGGFNDISTIAADLDIVEIKTSKKDLIRIAYLKDSLQNYQLPEVATLTGKVTGDAANLKLDLTFSSDFGNASLLGTAQNLLLTDSLSASGKFKLYGANPSLLSPSLTSLNLLETEFDFEVQNGGKDFSINGLVDSLAYESYLYTNLAVNAEMADSLVSFAANIDDTNLSFDITGDSDLKGKNITLDAKGSLNTLNLQELNLSSYSERISSNLNISMNSLEPASIVGFIELEDLKIGNANAGKAVATFTKDREIQKTKIVAPFLNAELTGDYSFATLPSYLSEVSEQLLTKGKLPKANSYFENIDIDLLASWHPIWEKVLPELYFEKQIEIKGYLKPTTSAFDVAFSKLIYNDIKVTDFTSNFILNQNELNGKGRSQLISFGETQIENTNINFSGLLDSLLFSFKTYAVTGEPLQTHGRLSVKDEQFNLVIQDITISNEHFISNNRAIEYAEEQLRIDNVVLKNADQSIGLNTTNNDLNLSVKNVKVGPFWQIFGDKADTLEADFSSEVSIKDFMTDYSVKGDLSLSNIRFNNLVNGDFYVTIKDLNNDKSSLEGQLIGLKSNVLFDGDLFFNDVNTIKLNLDIKRLDAQLIETLGDAYLDNAKGLVEGKMLVNGTLAKPVINGTLDFYRFSFNTPLLGTNLSIANKTFTLKDNIAYFQDFTLRDSLNQPLTVNGKVNFTDFEKVKYDLSVKTKNFHLLDAEKGENELYYGTANIDTDIQLKGINDEPSIEGKLGLNKSSKLTFIMPTTVESAESEGIVTFVPPADLVEKTQIDTTATRPSFTSNFISEIALQISTDPEATINIIIDQVTGDNLTVNGEANLTAGTDLNGDIFLSGKYEVSAGFYNFSLPPIFKRKFELEKGGTITWSGDPYKAEVDLRAFYEVSTDIQSLNTFGLNVDRYGRTPIDVLINIDGTVEKPEVSFDLRSSATAENSFKSLIEQKNIFGNLRRNTSLMNKQALSLLLTNSFFKEDNEVPILAGISGEAIARQSASKLLTDQLNALAGDILANSGLSFGLNSTQIQGAEGDEYKTDLNIGFNKSLFNDRIKVSAGKNFELENSTDVNQNSTELLDNVEISYYITPDGKYILKVYRDNEFQTILEGFVLETGVSLILSSDYNKIKELFKK